MTSRPLLASVAESIVILAPIVQVGWRRACAGVTAASSLGRRVEERAARRGQDQRARRPPSTRRRGTARSPSAPSRSAAARPAGWRTGRRGRSRRRAPRQRRGRAASRGGRRRRASPCWPSRRPCRPRSAARTGRRLTTPPVADDDEVDVVAGRQRLEGVRRRRRVPCRAAGPARRAPVIAEGDRDGRRRAACSASSPALRARRQGDDPEGVGMRGQDVDRLAADRAGRAEERDAARGRSPASRRVSRGRRGHTGSRPVRRR